MLICGSGKYKKKVPETNVESKKELSCNYWLESQLFQHLRCISQDIKTGYTIYVETTSRHV